MRHHITAHPSHETRTNSRTHADGPRIRAWDVDSALEDLAALPRDVLPDGPARQRLRQAIRAGQVDAIYQSLDTARYVLTLATLPPGQEPRRALAEWVYVYQLAAFWRSEALIALWLAGTRPQAISDDTLDMLDARDSAQDTWPDGDGYGRPAPMTRRLTPRLSADTAGETDPNGQRHGQRPGRREGGR